MTVLPLSDLSAHFGGIDIYLFDQLLKGRIQAGMHVLDAGCGHGRNSRYLMQAGCNVYGADAAAEAIVHIQQLAQQVVPATPPNRFFVADLAALPLPDDTFDVVLCSAVLHFARSEAHFRQMVRELWRVLKPGGLFFSRLGTTIGLSAHLMPAGHKLFQMPHGPVWFLADGQLLQELEQDLAARPLEPLKTVLVENQRAMTTWVLQKS